MGAADVCWQSALLSCCIVAAAGRRNWVAGVWLDGETGAVFTPRITWPDLPIPVRDEIHGRLGAQVCAWHGQVGGFSPGTADRLTLADGRRVFCKSVHPSMNEGSAALCRREMAAHRVLPDGLPAPALMEGWEREDGWIVLLFQDVEPRGSPASCRASSPRWRRPR